MFFCLICARNVIGVISPFLFQPDKVEKLFVEDMVVENYSPSAKNIVGQTITLLRKSLRAIPPGADELTAKQAVYDSINSFLKVSTPVVCVNLVFTFYVVPSRQIIQSLNIR